MNALVKNIFRYPVKGLSGQAIESVALEVGQPLPYDRHWAFIHASSDVDPLDPTWASKNNFLCLAYDEKLASLQANFSEDDKVLTLTRKGKQLVSGCLENDTGRLLLETFMAGFMPTGPRGNPKIVHFSDPASGEIGGGFFDDVVGRLSILNLATIRDIERITRQRIDPLRFRANILIDNVPAWSEFDWIARRVRLGGSVIQIEKKISRCQATNVNPQTAHADMNIPLFLRRGFGHICCGVYGSVLENATVRVGDPLGFFAQEDRLP